NLDFYFDAQPVRDWRSLVEIRYTNAPLGQVNNYGGLAGTFARANTRQPDPNAASILANQWAGEIVIERAQIDWTPTQFLKLRVGEFFTPFGIWNVDHGSPTLIPIAISQSVAFLAFPIRQIGIMAYGSAFTGPWELGYMATVSNGRQELSNFAFDDNRGFGGRLYASKDAGDLVLKFGASGYIGQTRDKEIDLTAVSPSPVFQSHPTFLYHEWDVGADASIDIYKTRIRAEAFWHRVVYDRGRREASFVVPGTFAPNRYENNGYLVVAQGLPWFGLEPYLMGEVTYLPFGGADLTVGLSAGLNVHFSPSVLLKTQLLRELWWAVRDDSRVPGDDPANLDYTSFYSRLVVVF
ncbi:MAG: hypothetical protein JOZ69_17025, partial [Myxococcales bacterium]|nr:hypothetical protein [Myxococcales bacterium]